MSQILASIVLFKSERDKTEAHILTYPDYTEKPDYSVPIESLRITAITRINERQVVMHTASDCSIKGCLFETINIKFPPLLIKGEGD